MPDTSTVPVHNATIVAEVVGVLQREPTPVVTLIIHPFTVELDDISDAHLGDQATVKISFSINSIDFQPTIRRDL
ncbi:MAG: hypothetical protein WCW40_05330 [Bacteroidota bacterium]